MPRLRILAGPSLTDLQEIQANTGQGVDVSSDAFEGQIAVHIQGFADPTGAVQHSTYFEHDGRRDVTWSIQFQGRFLKPYSADDVLFGNVFDHALPIPWGFSTILGFMRYIDPTLEHDLQSHSKPWALSPLISTMPHFAHTRADELHKASPFPPFQPLEDDTSELRYKRKERPHEMPEEAKGTARERRALFRSAEHRKRVTFGPEDLVTADFCYGYLSFSPTGVHLKLPGGFSLDLMRFWDGQPVRFVCGARGESSGNEAGPPLGQVFWCVAVEVIQDEEEDEGDEEESDDGDASSDDVD